MSLQHYSAGVAGSTEAGRGRATAAAAGMSCRRRSRTLVFQSAQGARIRILTQILLLIDHVKGGLGKGACKGARVHLVLDGDGWQDDEANGATLVNQRLQ